MRASWLVLAFTVSSHVACGDSGGVRPLGASDGGAGAPSDSGAGAAAGSSAGTFSDAFVGVDSPFDDDGCAVASEAAELVTLPVDIVWVVDNSASMAPAIAELTLGLNDFATLIAGKNLDYRVIMLSLRAPGSTTSPDGSQRYGVCIPEPLAGDASCGDGARFFHASVDVRSTQGLEQLLGTLGQTTCYRDQEVCSTNQLYGGPAWNDHLRANATKSIVIVTDDDQRVTGPGHCNSLVWDVDSFEAFAGGLNPFNCGATNMRALPPGILDASWNGLFDGYVFHGLYGWGSDTDPDALCTYAGGQQPPSPGKTYSHLVSKTGGVRAKICDGAAAWAPFFDSVAQAVQLGSKLACDLDIPEPSSGTLDPRLVNVTVEKASGPETIYKVVGAAACGSEGGWYYDDDTSPTRVFLCPATCDDANAATVMAGGVAVNVHFGCQTLVR